MRARISWRLSFSASGIVRPDLRRRTPRATRAPPSTRRGRCASPRSTCSSGCRARRDRGRPPSAPSRSSVSCPPTRRRARSTIHLRTRMFSPKPGQRNLPSLSCAEPVDHEDLRRVRDRRLHVQPVREVLAHVVAAEGEHRHRVAAHDADLARSPPPSSREPIVAPMKTPCVQLNACITSGIVVARRPPKMMALMGTPCGSSAELRQARGCSSPGAVKREFGCAAFSVEPVLPRAAPASR